MKSSVGKGALILIISGLICKFFGALFRLPLTNILGIEGIGIFQMIMSVYALLSAIVASGVSSALSKLISTARASGEMEKARKLYALAIKFALILALVLGFIILFLSGSSSSPQQLNWRQAILWNLPTENGCGTIGALPLILRVGSPLIPVSVLE